jgi:hypothetical protein
VFSYPPFYISDLTSQDFNLVGPLKKYLKGRNTSDVVTVKADASLWVCGSLYPADLTGSVSPRQMSVTPEIT